MRSLAFNPHSLRGQQPTEMALMSGSSLSPPCRAQAPVQVPASKHRLVHGLANNMVALDPRQSTSSYPQATN
jgi:hypothetical protein